MARRNPIARFLGNFDPAHLGDSSTEVGLFRNCKTVADAREVLRGEVLAEVDAMLKLVKDADAFERYRADAAAGVPAGPGPDR